MPPSPTVEESAREQTSPAPFHAHVLNTPTAQLVIRDYAGTGAPIVLLHGGPGVPDYLGVVAAMLAPRHRIITFDQRGVGASVVRSGGWAIENYLSDLEALRGYLGVEKLHLFGHSWGGLLGQLYAAHYPTHVGSLFLANSSLGVGADWKRMENTVLRYNRRQAGWVRFMAMGGWTLVSYLPGAIGDYGLQRTFAQVWRNYFPDAKKAPAADPRWLQGVRHKALQNTRRAILHEDPASLSESQSFLAFPTLVLYGTADIYGDATQVVLARFPRALHIRLDGAGHLPWIQASERFEAILHDFYQ